MVTKIINIIKCPRCNSTSRAPIAEYFFKCKQCGNSYYYNINDNNGSFINAAPSHQKNNRLVGFIIIGTLIFLIIYAGISLFNQNNRHQPVENEIIDITQSNDDYATESLNTMPFNAQTYARTAFVVYRDPTDNSSYLFRADFLTDNNDRNDQNVVSIKRQEGQLVAYDTSSQKIIANFNQLNDTPLSSDAAVLYSDIDSVIIKNNVNGDYQLEMLDAYTGDIVWTLSDKEVAGINNLTEKYLLDEKKGIKQFEDDFIIDLPPNYYLIDKKGNIVDFGLLD
ncbi:hypothetical protein [Orbus mooreae]|uniref:hypothetical protein n=1 Tax=Orbus mooreae TaxID=3074107 RepID=UPI00370D7C6F